MVLQALIAFLSIGVERCASPVKGKIAFMEISLSDLAVPYVFVFR